jgi:dihydroorotate dehydrogenase electron transfer subunit
MAKFTNSLLILSNRHISDEYFVLKLQAGEEVKDFRPGQFVQVRVDKSESTFLRRPISIYDVDKEANTFDLLIKIVGKGTEALSLLSEGDMLGVIYPLGNSFTIAEADEKVLLLGGGVGVAPLFLAGKALKDSGVSVEFILGYRTSSQIIDQELFSSIGEVHLTTEDNSAGEEGFVIDHSRLACHDYSRIYCCGPDPMMKAVAKLARDNEVYCEVSLENLMACGIGVCLCCIEETVDGNVCACTEGPVFNINNLKWQI